jgi:hypothetical protein
VVLHVPAEDVSDGDVDEIEVLAQALCLSAFSRALRPDDDVFMHGENIVPSELIAYGWHSITTGSLAAH